MKEKKKDENINEPIEEELPQQEAEDTEENTAEAEYVQPEAEEKEETPEKKKKGGWEKFKETIKETFED